MLSVLWSLVEIIGNLAGAGDYCIVSIMQPFPTGRSLDTVHTLYKDDFTIAIYFYVRFMLCNTMQEGRH